MVFTLDKRDIPIVHRVIKVHERREMDHIDILTKVGEGCQPTGHGHVCALWVFGVGVAPLRKWKGLGCRRTMAGGAY